MLLTLPCFMTQDSRNRAYIEKVKGLEQRFGSGGEALRRAVGGEFEAVGCGSGRLAHQLARHKDIRYIGTDVVPRLVEGAKDLAMRDDWEFRVVADVHIPCADNVADFVAFFSVLTHTTHEESFKYIQEAARSLKVGGQVVMSFLEFRIPCHWETFMVSITTQAGGLWNQFVDRDAISAWAAHSGLVVESFFDGDKGHIPIPEEIRWENGMCMKSLGSLGQSVAVLRKR